MRLLPNRIRTWFLFAIAFCLAWCPSCGLMFPPWAAKQPDGFVDLKLMSFNIRYGSADDGENSWDHRKNLVFKVIKKAHPDILGLQEALRFQLDEMYNAVPEYNEAGVGRDDGKEAGEYSAVLYRSERFQLLESDTFWFSSSPEVPGSKDWGNSITRICTWVRLEEKKSKTHFYVYNLHLDHQSQPSRERSAVLLTSFLSERKHTDPFIVTGDFNAGETNPVILFLKGQSALELEPGHFVSNTIPLQDTYRFLVPKAEKVGTFHDFMGTTTGDKIDYIFVQEKTKVTAAKIDHSHWNNKFPSDHFPVTASIRIPLKPY
jgi:endonuclease/exonuclease/phosphatase family metal-dependent hydrolase